MKTRLISFAIFTAFAGVYLALGLAITSCQSGGQVNEARLARIGDVALAYAERTGKISPEDAALAREAGRLVLSPSPATAETATK